MRTVPWLCPAGRDSAPDASGSVFQIRLDFSENFRGLKLPSRGPPESILHTEARQLRKIGVLGIFNLPQHSLMLASNITPTWPISGLQLGVHIRALERVSPGRPETRAGQSRLVWAGLGRAGPGWDGLRSSPPLLCILTPDEPPQRPLLVQKIV